MTARHVNSGWPMAAAAVSLGTMWAARPRGQRRRRSRRAPSQRPAPTPEQPSRPDPDNAVPESDADTDPEPHAVPHAVAQPDAKPDPKLFAAAGRDRDPLDPDRQLQRRPRLDPRPDAGALVGQSGGGHGELERQGSQHLDPHLCSGSAWCSSSASAAG